MSELQLLIPVSMRANNCDSLLADRHARSRRFNVDVGELVRCSDAHRVKAEVSLTAGISCLRQINRVFCHVLLLLSTQETLGGNFLSLIFESLVFQLVSL